MSAAAAFAALVRIIDESGDSSFVTLAEFLECSGRDFTDEELDALRAGDRVTPDTKGRAVYSAEVVR